jgi:O-glycosyl hydrolase
MRRSLSGAILGLALTGSFLTPIAPSPALASGTTAVVDPDHVYVQQFEGWGTALAWGANVVGGWSNAKRSAIADLLFLPVSGLGLNIVRYHIGAGQDPNWQALGCGEQRPGSPLPTYSTSPGVYDWSADANQRWFAQAAKDRGANKWLAYASAPPYWMTINGCTNGGDGGGQNLKGYWGYDGDGTGAYNSTTSYSNNSGDSVTLKFNGTQVAFYASKSADSGKAAISVDGAAETTVDLYSATRQGNQLVYTSPTLASGPHTLKVRVTGTKHASSSGYFVSPDRVVLTPGGSSIDDQIRGTGLNQFNYRWNMYEPFADYLTEVTKHFRDSWGITFDLLDPLNEPDAAWWTKTTRQEGAHFDPDSQNELVNRVGQSLAAKGLTGTAIAAPDADTVANAASSFDSYSSAAKNYVSTITTHTYISSVADQVTLRNTAASANKRLWMSEFGSGEGAFGAPGQYSDPTKAQPAINLASQIVTDMTNLRPSAWVQWDGLESWEMNDKENVSWGLIWGKYLDPAETYTVAKQYYGYGNFTKFIRPGHRIVASGDDNTLAAFDPVGKKLVLVAVNDATTARPLTYDLGKFDGITTATPYRTSDTETLAQLSNVGVSGNQLSVTLSPKSVTTFVMSGATAGLTRINDRDTGTGRNQFDYTGAWSNVTQPGAYLGDNSWSGSTNANYQVRFNGTKVDLYGATAPNHGKAAVSIDGGPETSIDFYSGARADNVRVYRSPTLAAGDHILKVRVTGTKNTLSTGVYIPADRVDVTQPNRTRLNDNTTGTAANQFDYAGSWGYGAHADAWRDDNHWSGGSNLSYQVRFNGQKVDLYGARAPNHGIAAVSVDGGPETLVDFYRPSRVDNVLVWSSPMLAPGAHTLKVRVTGTRNAASTGPYIPADRVDVFP